MSSSQTVVDREMFVQALRHMGEEDLQFLNRMVVERLNLLAQARCWRHSNIDHPCQLNFDQGRDAVH